MVKPPTVIAAWNFFQNELGLQFDSIPETVAIPAVKTAKAPNLLATAERCVVGLDLLHCTRAIHECSATEDGADIERLHPKHVKLLCDGQTSARPGARAKKLTPTLRSTCSDQSSSGGDWSWRTLLEKLHFFLDNETEGDALAWLEDGVHFVVHQSSEIRLEAWLGLRACSLHQVLEALGFHCREELHWDYSIYCHDSFVRGCPRKIEEMVADDARGPPSKEVDVVMPSVAYNSALKPLEVRLSLSDSHSQSWEVTIAPSVLPHPNFDTSEVFHFEGTFGDGSSAEDSWEGMLDEADQWSDHDVDSPMWWSQHSDFSSICTDDLSDMDVLSQISAYYG
ncbi:unnamed protein product [Phytophthora fragariaefolia]|uniref:Unnamed protein product n=1 Tax=Phytophthora fragariaefolia TaxID=1490495 RepID=A0A9W6WTT1_9STRA|nr:unnamed protein product [Phytophthora fragariaefolia]